MVWGGTMISEEFINNVDSLLQRFSLDERAVSELRQGTKYLKKRGATMSEALQALRNFSESFSPNTKRAYRGFITQVNRLIFQEKTRLRRIEETAAKPLHRKARAKRKAITEPEEGSLLHPKKQTGEEKAAHELMANKHFLFSELDTDKRIMEFLEQYDLSKQTIISIMEKADSRALMVTEISLLSSEQLQQLNALKHINLIDDPILFIKHGGTAQIEERLNRFFQAGCGVPFSQEMAKLKTLSDEEWDRLRYIRCTVPLPYNVLIRIACNEKCFRIYCQLLSSRLKERAICTKILDVFDRDEIVRGTISLRNYNDMRSHLLPEDRCQLVRALPLNDLPKVNEEDLLEFIRMGQFESVVDDYPLFHFSSNVVCFYINSTPRSVVRAWLAQKIRALWGGIVCRGETIHLEIVMQNICTFLPFYKEINMQIIDMTICCYAAESVGELEEFLQQRALKIVPKEPLLRFLSSKPFSEISSWLDEIIDTPEGSQKRVETLSQEQKEAILKRFRQYDSRLPLAHWMQKLDVSEDQARIILKQADNLQETPDLEEYKYSDIVSRFAKLDPQDPNTIFIDLCQEFFRSGKKRIDLTSKLISLVTTLLAGAKEKNACGGRVFLTWGTASDASVCSAHETTPLIVRIDGKPQVLSPRGLFNDPLFSVPCTSLRRAVIQDAPLSTAENNELTFEILRIAEYWQKRYASLFLGFVKQTESSGYEMAEAVMHGEGEAAPDIEMEEGELQPMEGIEEAIAVSHQLAASIQELFRSLSKNKKMAFLPLLRSVYEGATRSSALGTGYNKEKISHRNAFAFLSLFLLARSAKVQPFEGGVDITLGAHVHYHLQALDPQSVEIRLEDNPGIDPRNFFEFITDYPLHTLSPITPNIALSPQKFCSFVFAIQDLDEDQFYKVCDACIKLLQTKKVKITEDLFDLLKQNLPEGFSFNDEAKAVVCGIAKQYLGSIEKSSTECIARKTYLFDQTAVESFSEEDDVPYFIWEEGNFASLLCRFFTPVEPDRQDGNCAINAFLIALNGEEAYEDDEDRLDSDIQAFRSNVVAYAKEHREELIQEFGKKEVEDFIERYAADVIEWTGSLAWRCAAGCYHRPIRVYSRAYAESFTLNEKAEPEPLVNVGNPEGIPICLMQWSVHYCALLLKR